MNRENHVSDQSTDEPTEAAVDESSTDASDESTTGSADEATAESAGGTDVERLENEGDIAADYLEELLDIADLDGDLDMDVEGDRASVSIVGRRRRASSWAATARCSRRCRS